MIVTGLLYRTYGVTVHMGDTSAHDRAFYQSKGSASMSAYKGTCTDCIQNQMSHVSFESTAAFESSVPFKATVAFESNV